MKEYNKSNIPLAKTLRKNMTPWERKLWYEFLRSYPVRFQRQKAIGNYIVDFYCAKAGLVIELDGGGHYTAEQMEKDAQHYMNMWDEAKKSFLQYKESAARNGEEKRAAEERYRQLQEKCKEFEASFFDIQMENIKLKQELDRYRRTNE